jgi:hypothetical protein
LIGETQGAFPGQTTANEFTGNLEAFIKKYDEKGEELWTHQFGIINYVYGPEYKAVAVDDDGNAYVAGFVAGSLADQVALRQGDAFLRKYDPEGNILWTHQFGTLLLDSAVFCGRVSLAQTSTRSTITVSTSTSTTTTTTTLIWPTRATSISLRGPQNPKAWKIMG